MLGESSFLTALSTRIANTHQTTCGIRPQEVQIEPRKT